MSATKSIQNCFKTYKYCDNTCKYCTCWWTHFSSIGSILESITAILTSIVTILAMIEQVNTPLVQFWVVIKYFAPMDVLASPIHKYRVEYLVWINDYNVNDVNHDVNDDDTSLLLKIRISNNFRQTLASFQYFSREILHLLIDQQIFWTRESGVRNA